MPFDINQLRTYANVNDRVGYWNYLGQYDRYGFTLTCYDVPDLTNQAPHHASPLLHCPSLASFETPQGRLLRMRSVEGCTARGSSS